MTDEAGPFGKGPASIRRGGGAMPKTMKHRRCRPRPVATPGAYEDSEDLLRELGIDPDASVSAVLCGGDVDADWERAGASGEEAVGGPVATPDQDVVDQIGHALGVEQASDAPVVSSAEILRARDRHYWHLERRAAEEDR
jgi:Family of unknown function (DUF6335)